MIKLHSTGEFFFIFQEFLLRYSFYYFGCRHVFETGKLAPGYDWFRCVVNIPEDIVHVGEPAEGEQMAVMTGGAVGRGYGAATMVGKDEMNGRVNPGLETDDDDPAIDLAELKRRGTGGGGGGLGGIMVPGQSNV